MLSHNCPLFGSGPSPLSLWSLGICIKSKLVLKFYFAPSWLFFYLVSSFVQTAENRWHRQRWWEFLVFTVLLRHFLTHQTEDCVHIWGNFTVTAGIYTYYPTCIGCSVKWMRNGYNLVPVMTRAFVYLAGFNPIDFVTVFWINSTVEEEKKRCPQLSEPNPYTCRYTLHAPLADANTVEYSQAASHPTCHLV